MTVNNSEDSLGELVLDCLSKSATPRDIALPIRKIVRHSEYCDEGGACPVCGESLDHSMTLIVEDNVGSEHEIHGDCYTTE